jgi:hypothetical protein
MCLQQLSVSGALYRLAASLAESAFSSLTPLIEVFSRYISLSFVPRLSAASHGRFSSARSSLDELQLMGVLLVFTFLTLGRRSRCFGLI